ncbi:hypothetical protein CBER1_07188 [Cercospora berteroae]|uniref:Uncharacterized protein n=1 Tax=Cercospora berteroae TaxID=357750 RepID=A0A2S6BRW6_9PEZI|nr:hypothetical protein CBER1_07188 [Cercospora berteroae]
MLLRLLNTLRPRTDAGSCVSAGTQVLNATNYEIQLAIIAFVHHSPLENAAKDVEQAPTRKADETPKNDTAPLKIVIEGNISVKTQLVAGADPGENNDAPGPQAALKSRKPDMPFAEHLGNISTS